MAHEGSIQPEMPIFHRKTALKGWFLHVFSRKTLGFWFLTVSRPRLVLLFCMAHETVAPFAANMLPSHFQEDLGASRPVVNDSRTNGKCWFSMVFMAFKAFFVHFGHGFRMCSLRNRFKRAFRVLGADIFLAQRLGSLLLKGPRHLSVATWHQI